MEEQKTREANALQILAKAAEKYLEAQDDLGRSFVGPQINAAVAIIGNILKERWDAASEPAQPAESLKESEVAAPAEKPKKR